MEDVKKKLARLLRRAARRLDPPVRSYYEDEDDWYDDEPGTPGTPYVPHVCNESCSPACRATHAAVKEFRDILAKEIQRDSHTMFALLSDKPGVVPARHLRLVGPHDKEKA